jgi:hypothetical protein
MTYLTGDIGTHFNRPAVSPIALHKRQVDPVESVAEAFEFGHEHFELERLIL